MFYQRRVVEALTSLHLWCAFSKLEINQKCDDIFDKGIRSPFQLSQVN